MGQQVRVPDEESMVVALLKYFILGHDLERKLAHQQELIHFCCKQVYFKGLKRGKK